MLENEILKMTNQKDLESFWSIVEGVIDAAGEYSRNVKLWNNLQDDATAFKVRHVLEQYYGGSMNCLCERIGLGERRFYARLAKYDILCRQYGMHQVSKPKALLDLLLDPKRRESYRGRIKTKMANHQICPLQVLELSYRECQE